MERNNVDLKGEAVALVKGSVEKFTGLQTYITGPRDSKRAIILLTNAFGFEPAILRKLADKVAEAEFLVLAPDFYYADPLDVHNHHADRDRGAWMDAHCAAKAFEDTKAVIEALNNMGVTSIGVAGFCNGGTVAVKLAKYADLVKAVVILHPGPITDDEIKEVKVPTALLGAEEEHSAERLEHLGEILAELPDVESMLKIYPGTKHGWTLMYKTDDGAAVCLAKEAHSDMLVWLRRRV